MLRTEVRDNAIDRASGSANGEVTYWRGNERVERMVVPCGLCVFGSGDVLDWAQEVSLVDVRFFSSSRCRKERHASEGYAASHALRAELGADCGMCAGQQAGRMGVREDEYARQLGWRTSGAANAKGGGPFLNDGVAMPERTVARRTGPIALGAIAQTSEDERARVDWPARSARVAISRVAGRNERKRSDRMIRVLQGDQG